MRREESIRIDAITYFNEYTHPAGYVFAGHRHPEYELVVIHQGELEQICDERIFQLKAGEYHIIPPETFHRSRVGSETPAILSVIHFTGGAGISEHILSCSRLTDKTGALMKLLLSDIREHCGKSGEMPACDTARKLLEVFVQYSIESASEPAQQPVGTALIYRHAIAYMHENIGRNLSIAEIANHCLVSCTGLKSIFSHYTGKGCIAFFNELKLARARELLIQGYNCTETADTLGYSSPSYFAKKFRQVYGTAPSDFSKIAD